jgi:hypothetical protein
MTYNKILIITISYLFLASFIAPKPQLIAGTCGFNAQFNGSAENWIFHNGQWGLENGYLKTNGVPGEFASAGYDTEYEDINFEVRMNRVQDESGFDSNLLFIRGTVLPLGDYKRWNSFYGFYFTRNGNFTVRKVVTGGSPISLLPSPYLWLPSDAINQGDAWNTFRVLAKGTNLKYYINGTMVWEGADLDLTSGKVGLGMFSELGSTSDELRVDWATLSACQLYLPLILKN